MGISIAAPDTPDVVAKAERGGYSRDCCCAYCSLSPRVTSLSDACTDLDAGTSTRVRENLVSDYQRTARCKLLQEVHHLCEAFLLYVCQPGLFHSEGEFLYNV